jgi:hypothetical protein
MAGKVATRKGNACLVDVDGASFETLPCCGIKNSPHPGRQQKGCWLRENAQFGLRAGMKGFFDITLTSAATAMRDEPSSIFSAVERVGLRLDSRKGPVEMLVVDHVEKPSEN